MDNNRHAIDCYRRNVDERVYLRDVTSSEFKNELRRLGTCDVVLGGFPCQGFSKAGPKSTEDSRNVLYKEMLETVWTLKPKLFIAENVDGIYQNFKGRYVNKIVKDFEQIGYSVEHRILDAVSFGIPQHRRRAFFVGIKRKGPKFHWPIPTHKTRQRNGEFKLISPSQLSLFEDNSIERKPLEKNISIRQAIGDIVSLDSDLPDHDIVASWPEKYSYIIEAIGEGQKLCNVRHSPTSVYTWDIPEAFGFITDSQREILEVIGKNRRHKKYGNIPNGNPLSVEVISQLTGQTDIVSDLQILLNNGYLKLKDNKFDLKGAMFCSGLFKRPNWDEPSPTILTNFYNPRYFLHPEANRPFTLRECARLQGFPDTFIFQSDIVSLKEGYRLVGNAVAPPVGKAFAKSVKKYLIPQHETALI